MFFFLGLSSFFFFVVGCAKEILTSKIQNKSKVIVKKKFLFRGKFVMFFFRKAPFL
jgi:hypothetical protein